MAVTLLPKERWVDTPREVWPLKKLIPERPPPPPPPPPEIPTKPIEVILPVESTVIWGVLLEFPYTPWLAPVSEVKFWAEPPDVINPTLLVRSPVLDGIVGVLVKSL